MIKEFALVKLGMDLFVYPLLKRNAKQLACRHLKTVR